MVCQNRGPGADHKRIELADIFAAHGDSYLRSRSVAARHLKVMRAIVNCRTAALGGHRQQCCGCHYQRYLYHSCRNRHCPKCQTQATDAWRKARQLELLPVPYFHQVFTLPHELNRWVLYGESNQRQLLKLLFEAAAQTLLEFGQHELGGQVGFTLVLHTWDQELRPHFHLHVIIASGALLDSGKWRAGGRRFLFSVKAMSKMFRGKYLSGLESLLQAGLLKAPPNGPAGVDNGLRLLRRLSKKSWVIYSQAPFAGPRKLLDYLSRYTHRVAISNDRLVQTQAGQVTFRYRDRRDGDRSKIRTLDAGEFIGRFLSHVLPSGFMRIRHYGFLANRHRREKLAAIGEQLGGPPASENTTPPVEPESAAQWLMAVAGIDVSQCPHCGGEMKQTKLLPHLPPVRLDRPQQTGRAPPARALT